MEKPGCEEIIQAIDKLEKTVDRVNEPTYLDLIEKFLSAYIFIAALGAQITFSLILSDIPDPASVDNLPEHRKGVVFSVHKVRVLVALSWLFFTWTLAIASFCGFLLLNPKTRAFLKQLDDKTKREELFNEKRKTVFIAATIAFYLNALPLVAFLLLSLAVSAYVPSVGWLGASATSLFTLFTIAIGPLAHKGVTGRYFPWGGPAY
ncbi:hypothetical protein EG329_000996 [Mollisiaceae sp. DMI_Dod_QoI]|nr:hypothetical protein EG329_000996 [Helotiales sp. DMI_Dod_QoI]